MRDPAATRGRILDEALVGFAAAGYGATSLDALAAALGLSKQTILHHFGTKEGLLVAVVDRSAGELREALEDALARAGSGFARVEALVRAVFRLAGRRPELLGLVREVSRLGPPAATRLVEALDPLVVRARSFLEEEMAARRMRPHDPRLLLLSAYSTVIGVATEVEVLRAVGVEPTARSLVRRRAELLGFLRSALLADPPAGGPSGPGRPSGPAGPSAGSPQAGGAPGVASQGQADQAVEELGVRHA
ncbi:MAG TPA: TetR/AcrR family transcriptional regulator [Acidimicrobiales bacterium]|nr:TetR/AcrR family transcriptional regulator [Acidimicrobiales bacterium]